MKKKILMLCFFAPLAHGQTTPHIITFFIHAMPRAAGSMPVKDKDFALPGKILKSAVKQTLNPRLYYSGIYANYAGATTTSDAQGQITFERGTPEPRFHVLVTEDLKEVPIDAFKDKTLYGFAPDPKAPSALYLFEREIDPETGLLQWRVSHERLNRKKRLSIDTIILFANPDDLIVPLGTTNTIMSESFILPDFYITSHNNNVINAFRFLKVRHFFAPVKFEHKYQPDSYQRKIVD